MTKQIRKLLIKAINNILEKQSKSRWSLDKGGPGSGRHKKPETLAREAATASMPEVQRYQTERTPSAHAEMVEAFRRREAKQPRKPSEFDAPELKHPWD